MKHLGFTSAAKALTSRLSSRSVAAFLLPIGLCCSLPCIAADPRPLPQFERIVIDDHFPGAYQVEVTDNNGDGTPDIVAVGGSTHNVVWYRPKKD
ncbi:hypothetical protein SAMN05444166_5780 [Singulisphaera sp. GP187]|uniref:hypothetical protein n=1 Tax=Singulisphaera sp. GP187 TaxID=1882752 RepID=UPI0009266B49|nr:hypothetical protein [Singulisphaera sp. GP187]SIO58703.1 hypothetical protein SAMN05444166_5780 [Singulisphaera sp. GP187]